MALLTIDSGDKDMKSIMGKIVLVALIAAGAFGFYKILPTLIEFTENTLYLGAMIGGLALVLWWLASGGAKAIKYVVYGLAQFSLGWVIEMNPFNILQYRLDVTAEATKDLLKYKTKLESKKAELLDKINEADSKLKNSISQKNILEKAQAVGRASDNDNDNLELAVNTITNSKSYIDGIKPVYDDILRLLDYTQRAYRTATLELSKSKQTLDTQRDLYETVTTASSTVKKAWKALVGDDSTNADADKAIAFLKKDIGAKIGAIKTGIKVTSQYMDGKDLENAAKLQTTLTQLKDIDLSKTSYSDTLDSSQTKIELGSMKGGSNKYAQFLGNK